MGSNSPVHGSSSPSPITSNSPLQGSSSPSPIATTSPLSLDNVCSMSAEFHLSQPIQIEDANVGQKRKTSVVWNHFKKLKMNGDDKSECNYCKNRLTAKAIDETNHLHKHFSTCPRRTTRDIRQQILLKEQKRLDGSSVFLSSYHFDYDRSRMDLACVIIAHEYPLSIVEHFWFKRYSENLQPLFKVPSRHTMKRDVMKIYEAQKVKSMGLLDKVGSRIAITTDLWTASNTKRFAYLPCPHTVESISSTLVEYGLAMIVDGISKVRSSVVFWFATPKREQTFREAARQLKISCTKKLVLDVKTRWNSSYHMLSVALIYKDVFNRLKAREPLYTSVPTENDWELTREICGRLEIFNRVTKVFSGSQYPTKNLFFPLICEIRLSIQNWLSSSKENIRNMASKMMETFKKYWFVVNGIMGEAIVLDPR
ncbi:zinc finger BED domain-containing protein RICESLEEPER 2-like [Senna tora]|uniref:Zinc finger BED domain-containing protein RICESLEEPER 2-like n=1 Tax=Senna tora TaxID=362788 RepID=A0A834SIT7_9FABA|nr:zinc finger BED domain-containing protein RICESLEEPER 2-like [Senna tora]